MPEPVVLYEKKGHIAVITINRPEKMNAYNGEVCTLEVKYIKDFTDDPNLYVAILTGAGDKAFCGGADMRMRRVVPREGEPLPTPMPEAIFHHGDIKDVYKPIIAAINGYCVSGGLSHAMVCDIRIAAEHATFGLQQVRFGIPSPVGVNQLTRCVGLSNALPLILTGMRISAQEALRIGLIHKIVPLKDLMPAAFEMAELILQNPPTHVRLRKEDALRGYELPLETAKKLGGFIEQQVPPEETKEGVTSFLEKRKPDWSKIAKR